jgi:hypothetical protein
VLRTAAKWTFRLALLAALATLVARVVATRSASGPPGGHAVIGGDTWPPVPTNLARRD